MSLYNISIDVLVSVMMPQVYLRDFSRYVVLSAHFMIDLLSTNFVSSNLVVWLIFKCFIF